MSSRRRHAPAIGNAMPDRDKICSASRRLWLSVVSIITLSVLPAVALDARYTDADGDLVADTPARTVDPPALIFAYTPGEDPASYPRVWENFLQHLAKTTGKQIR